MNTLILKIGDLDPSQGGYPVSVHAWRENGLEDPSIANGLIAADLTVPGLAEQFTAEELRTLWAEAVGPERDLNKAGAHIYTLLSQSGIGNVLESAGQRVILDIRPAELQNLPWELMSTPSGELRFGDASRPLCRGQLDTVTEFAPLEWPLHLMVVVASSPTDEAVQAGAEMESLLDALFHCDPDVDLLIVKQPSKADLVAECQRFKPHILHFIGHGRVDGDSAYLELSQKSGDIEGWQPLSIQNDNLGDALRLVFINACRSSDVRESGLPSVSRAFLKARVSVPAVIGMTSDVNGSDAGRFAGRFYKSLSEGKAVDVAMAEARQAVWEHRVDGPQRREWAAPCLHVQRHPEQILRIGEFRGIEQQWRQDVKKVSEFKKNRTFVDRRDERYATWRRIADASVQPQSPGLMVIRGESEVGKSGFAKILLERCFIYGYDVLYINLKDYLPAKSIRNGLCGEPNFLTVLRAIRDGGTKSTGGLRQPFPPEYFHPFNRKINDILSKSFPCRELEDNEQQQLDADPNLDKWKRLQPENYRKAPDLFGVFRECLDRCATERPLVIVLDQLEYVIQSEFINYIYPELLQHYLAHPKIRFVLPLRLENYRDYEMNTHKEEFSLVEMSQFSEKDWEELAVEYIVRFRRNTDIAIPSDERRYTEARERIPEIRRQIQGNWKPVSFVELIKDLL